VNRTYYLKNKNNRNIADLEVSDEDISCYIDINLYTSYLLSLDDYSRAMFTKEINQLNDIRSAYFETNYNNKTTHQIVLDHIQNICDIFGLHHTSD